VIKSLLEWVNIVSDILERKLIITFSRITEKFPPSHHFWHSIVPLPSIQLHMLYVLQFKLKLLLFLFLWMYVKGVTLSNKYMVWNCSKIRKQVFMLNLGHSFPHNLHAYIKWFPEICIPFMLNALSMVIINQY